MTPKEGDVFNILNKNIIIEYIKQLTKIAPQGEIFEN